MSQCFKLITTPIISALSFALLGRIILPIILEKHVANIMSEAAEEHGLLHWNQMGARRKRSTLSAVGLLSSCVQTAWRTRRGCVVSILSLDLAGAFPNVSYETLLYILKKKGFLKWLTDFIQSFLITCKTHIKFIKHKSNWIQIETGIP